MKYEKCLTCAQLGKTCDGPNLLILEPEELREWLNTLRKSRPGMTYDRTSAETGVSKTAVYNFLTGAHPDCRLDTVRPITKCYIGGNCGENPCGNVTNSEKAAYEEKIRQLEQSTVWHEDKIKHLQETNAAMQTLITNTNARATQDKDFLRKQLDARYEFLKRKDKVIVILSVLLALCLLVIIGALIIDRTNSDVGFFWLKSLFKPSGITELIESLTS